MSRAERPTASDEAGAGFWAALAIGLAIMAFALRGAIENWSATNPPELLRWMISLLLVHDVVVAPVVAAITISLSRRGSAWWARPVASGLAATAVVLTFSLPLVRRFGERQSNPSALPRDYGSALFLVLVAIWSAVVLTVAIRARRNAGQGWSSADDTSDVPLAIPAIASNGATRNAQVR